MDISVVIVNYNTHGYLKYCLDSIIENNKGLSYELIVVDNNSSDKTIKEFSAFYKNVRFYFLDKNNGFGYGCNYGIKQSSGDYLLILNPDIKMLNAGLKELFLFMKNNLNAGICSGLLVNEEGVPQYCFNKFPDLIWEFKEAYGINLSGTVDKLLNHPYIKTNEKKVFEVDWFHGACLMVSRKLFDMINGFDENIFLYYEDVDFCYRIKKLGYENFCLPYVRLIHYERSSVRTKEGTRIYHFYMQKSKLYYMKRYFNILERVIVRFMFITGSLIRIIILPFKRKYKHEISEKFMHYCIVIKVHLGLRGIK